MVNEIYISVDIESSGPIPGEYSMLSLGACLVYKPSQTFYVEFKPISDKYVMEALVVSGLYMTQLKETGLDPTVGMTQFEEWINKVCQKDRPVFTAFNATFDWMFMAYYFHRFLGRNPFGISGLDIKAYYMGKFNTRWEQTTKRKIDPSILPTRKHTHYALDDALEQAELFRKILDTQS